MGASISVNFKSASAKQKAMDFVHEHAEAINKLCSRSHPFFSVESFCEDDDIPYGPARKNLLGMKESVPSRELIAFMVWLADKSDKTFVYWDAEKIHFAKTRKFESSNKIRCQVNENGVIHTEYYKTNYSLLDKVLWLMMKKDVTKMRSQLETLNTKWLEFSKTYSSKPSVQNAAFEL